MINTELLKQRPNVDDFNLQPHGYIVALTTYVEKLEKQLTMPVISGSISEKAEMINALTNTLKVNKESLGGYSEIREKALEKLKATLDNI